MQRLHGLRGERKALWRVSGTVPEAGEFDKGKRKMGKSILVNGALVATTGDLYSHNIIAGGSFHPVDAEVITPPGGVLEITEDTGSIFNTYYVSGYVTAGGILGLTKGAICAFADIYEFTLRDYADGLRLIESMLERIPAGSCGNLYLQQQYASVFSLMEKFLSFTFVRQTCDNEDSYRRVLASGLLQQKYGNKDVLNGPDGLKKELKYIELANKVVYHNQKAVKSLFDAAFGIDVDLSPLEGALTVRNDIMHRFGHTIGGADIVITLEEVKRLIAAVDGIVNNTARQILAYRKGIAIEN